MNCKQVHEYLFDFDTGQAPAAAEEHVRSCAACAAELASLRQTMSLMDSWQVPEPSPYFDTKLRARVREQAVTRVSWWEMIRRPALALALTLVVAAGVMIQGRPQPERNQARYTLLAPPGTAVGDLQSLDKNHDLIANIELLDDVAAGGDQSEQLNP